MTTNQLNQNNNDPLGFEKQAQDDVQKIKDAAKRVNDQRDKMSRAYNATTREYGNFEYNQSVISGELQGFANYTKKGDEALSQLSGKIA